MWITDMCLCAFGYVQRFTSRVRGAKPQAADVRKRPKKEPIVEANETEEAVEKKPIREADETEPEEEEDEEVAGIKEERLKVLRLPDNQPFAEGHDEDDEDEATERQWTDAENRGRKWPTVKYEQFMSIRAHELKKLAVSEVPGVGPVLADKFVKTGVKTVCARCSPVLSAVSIAMASPLNSYSTVVGSSPECRCNDVMC